MNFSQTQNASGTAWNGLFAVFVEFFQEEQKSTCNPFRHEWNLNQWNTTNFYKIWILLFSKIDQKLQ